MGPGVGTLHALPEVPNDDVVPASSFLLNVHCLPSDGHLALQNLHLRVQLGLLRASLGPLGRKGSFELLHLVSVSLSLLGHVLL